LDDGTLNISLEVSNPIFKNQVLSFLNVIRYELLKPNRAILGEDKMFMAVLSAERDPNFELPTNLFMLQRDGVLDNPAFIVSNAGFKVTRLQATTSATEAAVLPVMRLTADRGHITSRRLQEADTIDPDNIASREDIEQNLFTSDRSLIALPYLPFFSNCEFYGSYIFNPTVIEAHPKCDLKPLDGTKPISDFGFGMTPTADTCEEVVLECR